MSNQPIAIKLELPERATAGQPIVGRLSISNVGGETLSLAAPQYTAALNIVVFDKYWDLVAPDSQGKAHQAYQQIDLAAGESVSVDLPDLAYTSGTAAMAFRLARGTYHIVAIYHPGTARLPGQSVYPIAAASDVVTLTVQ